MKKGLGFLLLVLSTLSIPTLGQKSGLYYRLEKEIVTSLDTFVIRIKQTPIDRTRIVDQETFDTLAKEKFCPKSDLVVFELQSLDKLNRKYGVTIGKYTYGNPDTDSSYREYRTFTLRYCGKKPNKKNLQKLLNEYNKNPYLEWALPNYKEGRFPS